MMTTKYFDFVIGGTGLSGLQAAHSLVQNLRGRKIPSRPWRIALLESANRHGGRVHTASGGIDLGGAWMWIDHQPALREFLREHDLETEYGKLVPQVGADSGEHLGPAGVGNMALILALEKKLKDALDETLQGDAGKKLFDIAFLMNTKIVKVKQLDYEKPQNDKEIKNVEVDIVATNLEDGVDANATDSRTVLNANQLLLAIPPAKVIEEIELEGCKETWLTQDLSRKMEKQPVWMGNIAKIALYYEDSSFYNPEEMFGSLPMLSKKGYDSYASFVGGFQVYDAGEVERNDLKQCSSGVTKKADSDGHRFRVLVIFAVLGEQSELISREDLASIVVEQLWYRQMQLHQSHHDMSRAENPFKNYVHAEWKVWRTDPNITSQHSLQNNMPEHPDPIFGINNAKGDRGQNVKRSVWFANTEAAQRDTGLLSGAIIAGKEAARLALSAALMAT